MRFIVVIASLLTALASGSTLAQPSDRERSASRAAPTLKKLVENGDIEGLFRYYRRNPKDERFRLVESEIEVTPEMFVAFIMGQLKVVLTPKDPMVPVTTDRDWGGVRITVTEVPGRFQSTRFKHAQRWGLVRVKDKGMKTITWSTTMSGSDESEKESATRPIVEVQAIAARFQAKVLLFSSKSDDASEADNVIIEITGARPKE